MSVSNYRAILISSTILIAAMAVPAHAQDSEEAVTDDVAAAGEIIVTGSRVGRTDATARAPISVLSSDDILDTGAIYASEALRRDPAIGSGTRGPSNSLSGGGAVGVDIRNLGNRRTLVLVNGHRYPLFSDSIGNVGQDIGGIPTALVERIEVLRDGASTAYGADAVSGVVNFILRERFEGVQLDAYAGISGRGDGAAYRFAGLFGTSSDRGSIVVAAQYQKQEEIRQDKRGWATNVIQSLADPAAVNGPITNGGRVIGAGGAILACYPVDGGSAIANPSSARCPRESSADQSSLVLGSEIKSIGVVANYELSDNIKASVRTFYSDRDSRQRVAAVQINTSGLTGPYPSGFFIPAASPNNPYGQNVRLQWRPSQYGARITDVSSEQFWLNAGLSGGLFGDFTWEVSHTYAQTKAVQANTQNVNAVNLNYLLNPALCVNDPRCVAAGAVASIPNLLSNAVPLTQAQQDYIFFDGLTSTKFVSEQTLATISGSLFDLPAGAVKLALGAEHRRERGIVNPDAVIQSGEGIGSFVFPTDGKFSTKEVFGEIDIPLLRDQPFAYELTLNLQARYSDFSNFGGADTYKVGLNYAPSEDIRLRATFGTSFRAPDVPELYGGGSGTNGSFQDPCNAGGLRASNSTVAANCTALGVPAGYSQLQSSLPTRSGGNPALQPEKGRTYTIGTVITPTFLPGLTITADYFNVRIKDAISAGLLQQNINNCYLDPNFAARAANAADICFSFDQRNPTGELGRVLNRAINVGGLKTAGIDFSARYEFEPTGILPGKIAFDLRGSYLDKFYDGLTDQVGKFLSGVDGRAAYPRWRGLLETSYSSEDFDILYTVNFTDKMKDSEYGRSVPVNNYLNYSGTPRYFTHDLLLKVRPTDKLSLTLGVNNLFDKQPPYAFVLTRNTLTTVFDQIGRYVFTSAKVSF